jgi:hypothetical protein
VTCFFEFALEILKLTKLAITNRNKSCCDSQSCPSQPPESYLGRRAFRAREVSEKQSRKTLFSLPFFHDEPFVTPSWRSLGGGLGPRSHGSPAALFCQRDILRD